MYELNRVRLFGVGPRGARYTDVTLDLSGVGAAVGGQGALFGTAVRRPSPYSLLLLENGGGKSVLLKLLFSVVLPGRRNTVGGSASVMEKFVVGDDAAHVVLEWMHVRSGERVITGKTLQRRRSGPAGDKLGEHWWSLRPHADVEIDALPFTVDGRRLRLDGFRDALQEIDRVTPVTQLTWVGPEVGSWVEHLRAIGIEPDLFGIQRRMNADEGDAATAFKFRSSREFVEWLLNVVLDPQDPASVAENFGIYARTVGDRRAMLLEKEFADGAVAALRPVGAAHERYQRARAARATAETSGLMLLGRVRAREIAEGEAADRLKELADEAAGDAEARENDRDRARDIVNETRRQTLALELAAAQREKQTAAEARDLSGADLVAWELAGLLDRQNTAERAAAGFTEQILRAEADARPLLHDRDRAAGRLLGKLAAEAGAARDEQARLEELAGELLEEAREADTARTQVTRDAERWRTEQTSITGQVAESRRQVEAAVTAGLLPAGRPVPDTAAEARDLAGRAAADLTRLEQLARDADATARAANGQAGATAADLLAVRGRRDDTARTVQAILGRAADLAGDEIVRAALNTDTVGADLLDDRIDSLTRQLEIDAGLQERHLDGLRAEQRDDQRLLDALGDGGFLPPRADVQAALDVLHAAGISAHSGWQYLADSVAAGERDRVIAEQPQLADGVIVADTTMLATARAVLTAARLLPAAAVAVATGDRMLTPAAEAGAVFVIGPNPALFDPDAAEQRREQLRHAMTARGAEISDGAAALTRHRAVLAELIAWRRDCPAGRLTVLRDELAAREEAVVAAAETDTLARQAVAAAEADRDRAAEDLAELRLHERAAADRAGELTRLAGAVAVVDRLRERLPDLTGQVTRAERSERELGERAESLRGRATEATRSADNAAARAERQRTEMTEVATSTGEHSAEVPDDSVPDLRAVYRAAQAAYAAVEVGQDIRAEAVGAENEAARLRTQVSRHSSAEVDRAQALLASPDGTDETGRQAAIARTRRERDTHDAAVSAATAAIGELGNELKSASRSGNRPWTMLSGERRPTDVAHGRTLQATAEAEHRDAQREHETAEAHALRLRRRAGDAREAARAFREVRVPLDMLLDKPKINDDEPIAAYEGTAAAAASATDRVKDALRAASTDETAGRTAVGRLVDAAVLHAGQPKFESMNNVSRRAIAALDRDQLATRAIEFATQLEQRLATLTTDLDSAGQHRGLIVDRLAALVVAALKTLRTASRLSKLPPGLGEWEGKEFLRIRFTEPDPALLAARVGEVIDDMAAAVAGRGAGPAPKRDGLALLLRSIEAAVPKGFTVDLLKPDAVLRDERVPIENMNEVFSGGQELTAAIVLYCTMAALRANERGQMRTRHSGVLFLDNPIGKASAEYLLELQQGVAAALGVQLVYTTGLSDDRALSAFPLWVRMRNDADLRAGLKHIRVAEVVRRQLPAPYADDEESSGTVTATRVFRRPA
ncbi:hypothetical protein [Actinoplanes couchii]|uniref:Uncharacterized protein n=1 Tax=Actinoplanes couchii TaxID=403638 RepID=A0ABQ3XDW8_9ACTN|nr:hypothetical protein [Actinoplanes couchii]MDR6317164.1 hypothetical protein [Actinoplanes couchii]GID56658.1 hypothetical protein Aco03nite_050620 [Actinoplanes couchii]